MFKKLLLPTVVLSVGLVGCSSGDANVASLQQEVTALKQEVAALKQQVGGTTVSSSEDSKDSNQQSSSQSSNGVYSTGQEFVHNGITYTITERERTKNIAGRLEPVQGKEFLLYDITIHNTSDEDYKFSSNDYSIVLSTGEIDDSYLIIDLSHELADRLSLGDLASGGKKTGWVAFEIPEGDQPLEIRYEKRSFSGTNDSFKVKL